MADKPSYIGLLNAIANGERGGAKIFKKWAEATTCDDIRPTLQTVAIREAEHSLAFEKRLCELGFGLREKENPELNKTVKVMKSDCSDLEKFEHLGYGKKSKSEQTDALTKLLEDATIDPQTGALLGRFICEERDTVRRLTACYEFLKKGAAEPKAAASEPNLERLTAQLAALSEKVEAMSRLKAVR